MMVPPGCRAPDFSASSTMASAMRSLMEPPGLPRSDLIHTLAPAPNRRLMRTWGVLPIVCRMLSALIGPPRVGVVVGQSGVARRRCAKTRHSLCTQLFYAWAISIWPGRLTSPHESTVPGNLRSEEHTSELQSPCNLVCRLLLEKKKKKYNREYYAYESSDSPVGRVDHLHDRAWNGIAYLSVSCRHHLVASGGARRLSTALYRL